MGVDLVDLVLFLTFFILREVHYLTMLISLTFFSSDVYEMFYWGGIALMLLKPIKLADPRQSLIARLHIVSCDFVTLALTYCARKTLTSSIDTESRIMDNLLVYGTLFSLINNLVARYQVKCLSLKNEQVERFIDIKDSREVLQESIQVLTNKIESLNCPEYNESVHNLRQLAELSADVQSQAQHFNAKSDAYLRDYEFEEFE